MVKLLLGHDMGFSQLINLYCSENNIKLFKTLLLCIKAGHKTINFPKPIRHIIFDYAFKIYQRLHNARTAVDSAAYIADTNEKIKQIVGFL